MQVFFVSGGYPPGDALKVQVHFILCLSLNLQKPQCSLHLPWGKVKQHGLSISSSQIYWHENKTHHPLSYPTCENKTPGPTSVQGRLGNNPVNEATSQKNLWKQKHKVWCTISCLCHKSQINSSTKMVNFDLSDSYPIRIENNKEENMKNANYKTY